MRIVGGKHRGRSIEAPAGDAVRPTADRTREAIFNILLHAGWGAGGASPLQGARVLDAFCGTGAMGLEALSRGAAFASFMDKDARAIAIARANADKLKESAHAQFVRTDALRPPRAADPCGVAFLDPPYGSDLTSPALDALGDAGWLGVGAIACVEFSAKQKAFSPPARFDLLDTRRYGAAAVAFLRYLG